MKHIGLFLCARYLRRLKMMLLSVTAVALSCALLIVTASLFTGFIAALENSASLHLGDVVLEAPSGFVIPQYGEFLEVLEQTAEVQAATGVLKNQGLLLIGEGKVRPVRVWGIELPRRQQVTPLEEILLMQTGQEKVSFGGAGPAEVGGFVGIGLLSQPDEITDEYDMEAVREYVGKRMALTTGSIAVQPEESAEPDGSKKPPVFKRRVLRFTCRDVMYSGVWDLDEQNVFVPIESLSELLHPEQPHSAADIIQMRLAPGVSQEAGLAAVQKVWNEYSRDRFSWGSSATIETSRRMQARLISEYRKQMGVLLLIFGLVSLSVVLLVFCIFSLLVMTKRKDIAILKSCGTGSGQVAGLFLLFGLLNGLAGGALGILIGAWITWKINPIEHWISEVFGLKLWKAGVYMFTRIPNEVYWPAAGWIVLAAVFAAVLGALVPAIRAALTRPVHILRYE